MNDWFQTPKYELVNQVKAWQKMSESHKEAWYRFVQETTGEAKYDPNRHDEATLITFIQSADKGEIELRDPTGFGSSGRKKGKGGGSWGGSGEDLSTAGKEKLVNLVKGWQRTSSSHKEAWDNYVQTHTGQSNFDPNRHDEATLVTFLQMADSGQIAVSDAKGKNGKGGGSGKGDGGWGGGGLNAQSMQQMMEMMQQMMEMKGGGGKGWRSGPY